MTAKRLSKFATAIRDNQQVASFIRGKVGRAGPAILSWSLSPVVHLDATYLTVRPRDTRKRAKRDKMILWRRKGDDAKRDNS